MAAETDVWQSQARLDVVLELLFLWLGGEDLARCGAVCRAWRQAVRRAGVWRQLLCRAGSGTQRALAGIYEGACPWRELYIASIAPWRCAARLTPERPARLAAAALNRAGDLLAIAAEDCSFTIWVLESGKWARAGAGSVALGWTSVARAEWAPDAPLLLLAGPAPLSAQRGALVVLRPRDEGSLESWEVAARASGGGGCWAGEGFLSLELSRLSAVEHAPVFGTDVWLNAATQETEDEFAGTTARVLHVYNEARAAITQVVCADVPLDARAAQEWAEAEATARAQDLSDDMPKDDDVKLEEVGPDEAYYRAIYDRGRTAESTDAWVRVVVMACGGVLGVWPLSRERPPPLRVPDDALRQRMRARAERRQREAEAAAAGAVEAEAPELSVGELRARCDPPTTRLRLPAPALGLTALQNPCGGSSTTACVWGPAGAAARLSGDATALAVLLPRCRARPTALLLAEDACHVWQCTAPRAHHPDANNNDTDNSCDNSEIDSDSSSCSDND